MSRAFPCFAPVLLCLIANLKNLKCKSLNILNIFDNLEDKIVAKNLEKILKEDKDFGQDL